MAATTYYDVVTRYSVDDRATVTPLNRYRRGTERTDRSVGGLQRRTAALGRSNMLLVGALGAATGGLAAMGGTAFFLHRTFRNLNEELNASLRMATQMNLAFQFEGATTASENFVGSLRASRQLIRGLTQDAARLPGELSDFIQIANVISGGVYAGGGDPSLVRDLTSRIALAAPNDPSAGRQAMRILFGTASVADSTMFAMMQSQGLLRGPGGGALDTAAFNALPAAERLRVFDEGLRQLTDNPMFRKEILRTFDTQLGTLSDNLFGPYGIGGQLMRGPFNDVLDALVDFNTKLEAATPGIVSSFNTIVDHAVAFGSIAGSIRQGTPSLGYGLREMLRGTPLAPLIGLGDAASKDLPKPVADFLYEQSGGIYKGYIDTLRLRQMWRDIDFSMDLLGEGDKDKFTPRKPPPINQNFTIQVDLKSDHSPEAIAVRMKKAMEKVGRSPGTSRRALDLLPEA